MATAARTAGRAPAALLVLLVLLPAAATAAPGWFGLAMQVDADEGADPTLRTITIVSVVPGSPAARAGLRPGDRVVAAQGVKVAGAHAAAFRQATQPAVGETLRLRVRRGQALREVTLVGVEKPADMKP